MLHRMTEEEIKIRKMNNLRMISVYEFTGAAKSDAEKINNLRETWEDRPAGCMAATAFYGENEQMTFCELDPYFDEFVDRLFLLYAESKDPTAIIMDTATRKLFETGRYSEEEFFQRTFADRKPVKMPRLSFENVASRRFSPLIRYIVEEVCNLLDREETYVGCICGWHGRGILSTMVAKDKKEHPFRVVQVKSKEYQISVGDFPQTGENMRVDVLFKTDQMDIAFVGEKTDIVGSFVYTFRKDSMKIEASVYFKQKPICYETASYQSTVNFEDLTEQEKNLLPDGIKPDVLYALPWDMIYAKSETARAVGDIEKSDFCGAYLFLKAGYSESVYWTRIHNTTSKVMLKMNSAHMQTMLFEDGGKQVAFANEESGASGRYRQCLAGKCFVVNAKDVPKKETDSQE